MKRRIYTELEITEIMQKVAEKYAKGQTILEVLFKENISPNTYYSWKRAGKIKAQPYVEQIQLELERLRSENDRLRKKLGELLIEREMK